MDKKTIRVIFYPVDGEPELRTIKDELREYQKLVGGHIEPYRIKTGLLALMDEDGWEHQRPHHKRFGFFLGDLVLVATSGEEFVSVTDEDVRRFERVYGVHVRREE